MRHTTYASLLAAHGRAELSRSWNTRFNNLVLAETSENLSVNMNPAFVDISFVTWPCSSPQQWWKLDAEIAIANLGPKCMENNHKRAEINIDRKEPEGL